MGVKVMERLLNRKWCELLGRYIFGLQEMERVPCAHPPGGGRFGAVRV